jgi:hypothetical protein
LRLRLVILPGYLIAPALQGGILVDVLRPKLADLALRLLNIDSRTAVGIDAGRRNSAANARHPRSILQARLLRIHAASVDRIQLVIGLHLGVILGDFGLIIRLACLRFGPGKRPDCRDNCPQNASDYREGTHLSPQYERTYKYAAISDLDRRPIVLKTHPFCESKRRSVALGDLDVDFMPTLGDCVEIRHRFSQEGEAVALRLWRDNHPYFASAR